MVLFLLGCLVDKDLYDDRFQDLLDLDGDGFTVLDGDCDDEDNLIHPSQSETCDGIDNNCDGLIDEDAVDTSTWFADLDGDGFGSPTQPAEACTNPDGHVSNSDDCDDGDASTYPEAEENWSNAANDNDCDGKVEDILEVFGTDAILGTEPEARFGVRMSPLGDVNDDGIAEFVVAAPNSNRSAELGGAIFLVNGVDGAQDTDFVYITDNIDFAYTNVMDGGVDVTGNGIPDLIATTSGVERRGAAFLLDGTAFDRDSQGTDIDEAAIVRIEGVDNDSYFSSAAFLGDTDGDGLENIGIGSSLAPGGGYTHAGRFAVWNKGSFSDGTVEDADWLIDGYFDEHFLSARAESAGDINDDGYDDFLLTGQGVLAQILPGGLSAPSSERDAIFSLFGLDFDERCDVKMLGDVDGDGSRDVACVSNSEAFRIFTGLQFNEGLTTDAVTTLITFPSGPSYAYDITSIGDRDGDGRDEVLLPMMEDGSIGAPSVHLLFGAEVVIGTTLAYEDLSIQARCNRPYSDFGYRVLLVEDSGGDGQQDLVLSTSGDNHHGDRTGGVMLLTVPD